MKANIEKSSMNRRGYDIWWQLKGRQRKEEHHVKKE
jgi:hypothetical protein